MKPTACLALLLVAAVPNALGEEASILARNLSACSKNVAPVYPRFGDLTLCVGKNGFMEWTAELKGGPYYIHFFYASGEHRPCRMTINSQEQFGEVLGEITGGFVPEHLRWQTYGPVTLRKGKNAIRIATPGLMPHLKGLAISSGKTPPDRHVLRDPEDEAKALPSKLNVEGLRAAVLHLAEKYREDYPQGRAYFARLDEIEKKLTQSRVKPEGLDELAKQLEQLRHEALVSHNPLLQFDKLLFVKRYTYQSSHYYTDYIDGCEQFGGNLCVLSLADGKVTELVPELKGGIFGRFDLSFDGRRVLFGYRPALGRGFRIWEVGVDGQRLRQLTFDPPNEQQLIQKYRHHNMKLWAGRPLVYTHHTDDMHPCYLADGGICFVSTRCERGILCDGPDVFTTTTLYRMDGDGKNMEVLSDSPVSEASPSLMNDGRILYTRWEYVDKADVVIKCLWAMRPDGTGSVEIFGNDITFPDSFLHGRAIPGHHNLFVVIGAPHMPLGVGTVIRLDINHPIRTREPMTYITPETDIRTEHGYFHNVDGRWVRELTGPLYVDAQPLSEKFFLVACNPDKTYNDVKAWGLYLLDEFGNRVLIHRDQEMSCWQPIPLRPRRRPPVLPPVHRRNEPATLMMSDVYRGLDGVRRGTIKYLRVMETVPRPWAARRYWDGDEAYQQHAVVSLNGSLHVKRIHGIVPVDEDGSAHFHVPADKNLFFQALDEDFMEVQRMRTFVNLRPGESRSCIGCHELRQWAPANKTVLALHHPPRELQPQPGDQSPLRPIYYPTDVQPILDRHCVRCHGGEKTDAELDLTGELTTLFSRSYENLLKKDLVQVFHENDPKTGDASPIPSYTLGSHASKLVKLIRDGHEEVRLSREEFIRLVTWIDANSPYYGSYFGRRNLKYRDHPDFRPLAKLQP